MQNYTDLPGTLNVAKYEYSSLTQCIMCGRYSWFSGWSVFEERFDVRLAEPQEKRSRQVRYNAAPGQQHPVVLNAQPKQLIFALWGLQPKWASRAIINARSEKVNTSPVFRQSLRERRYPGPLVSLPCQRYSPFT